VGGGCYEVRGTRGGRVDSGGDGIKSLSLRGGSPVSPS